MPRPQGPFLVIKGDILTGVPFQQMLQYYRSHRAMLTVGVCKYELQVLFGVVDCDDVWITRIEEKPCSPFEATTRLVNELHAEVWLIK
jgi:NDP-sugar pyrophosphorylase family protein